MHPRVSVVVPVYNVEKYLEKCLRSIENQTLSNFEAIVVDDGSSDSSFDIARSFERRDDRFRVLTQKNLGLGGARNTGIAQAKGEFLFLLDSDDYIREDALQSLVSHSDEHDLDILVFNYDRVNEAGDLISRPEFNAGISTQVEAFRKIVSLKTSPQACNKLYKTSLFLDNGICYPEAFLHEDIAVSYKLFWLAKKIGYLDDSYYFWVIRGGSITSSFNYKHINDLVTSLSKIKQHLVQHSVFEVYQLEYIEGCVKMLNLMMERAVLHQRLGCIDYLIFLIDGEGLVSDVEVQMLEERESDLLLKFRRNYKNATGHIDAVLSAQASLASGPRLLKTLLIEKFGAIKSIRIWAYKLSYVLLPLESSRRETFKKMIRKFF